MRDEIDFLKKRREKQNPEKEKYQTVQGVKMEKKAQNQLC